VLRSLWIVPVGSCLGFFLISSVKQWLRFTTTAPRPTTTASVGMDLLGQAKYLKALRDGTVLVPAPTKPAVTSPLRSIQATSQESILSLPNSPTNVANQRPPMQTQNRQPRHDSGMPYIWPSSVVHV